MRRSAVLGVVISATVACAGPSNGGEPTTAPPIITIATTSTTIAISTTATTVAPPFRVLVFHETAGFTHDSIQDGIAAITELGTELGFTVTATADSSVFTDPDLSGYRVIVFLNTTGDVLDTAQEQAMERFIRPGKGFAGIHSAADTEYEWEWYGGLVGAYFAGHPEPQTATVVSSGSGHPAAEELPESFQRFDEWYNFQRPPGPGVVVLATLDETSYSGGTMGAHHPIAWAHEYDGGRAFYTGFGHTAKSFSEGEVLLMLGNAILWVAGES